MDLDLLAGYLHTSSPSRGAGGTLLSNLTPRRLTSEADENTLVAGPSNPRIQITRVSNSNQLGLVISKMEKLFESITDCILDEKKELVIQLKSRPKRKQNLEENYREVPEKSTKITFPSKNAREAWKFTALLRILELSHEALITGIVTTKRDIYYRDPKLFMKQAVVDRYVDDIAYTFGVSRDALNVATFRTLATDQYWKDSIAGKGVLITAKGYPDIQTRKFLHILSSHYPGIPILALVDFDPDGIGIISTYKYGSQALAHETNLAVPSIRWLGVQSCDLVGQDQGTQGLLKLSVRDRRIASKMLEKANGEDNGVDDEMKRELQVMLVLNFKAEIQILGNGEKLGEWLDRRLLDSV
ncbi:hypothetical protein QTJ16_006541 [Diplocarpon rosae]|uniref:DNA topoisomerase (ATP-hydrolyzing) n=1 Tax=Diplocarpon rosae TaxID=946125 RepID=A0AAD9SUY2_9HELO|nr:hypothetical protein QTJ16_006541 [Diplocarpon rosae]